MYTTDLLCGLKKVFVLIFRRKKTQNVLVWVLMSDVTKLDQTPPRWTLINFQASPVFAAQ